ncbi:two-component system response regulator [Geomonas silvestris]|uniref:Two-component system response regulator n=1 Tax=Geomonas silvestris TaxID=2740184 RepID=A0A6V8MEB3_9BACT|nr:response regulator [Geomonas silvestris]GFO58282.1 two-component system response regulator [Geomonas silvestris]
MAKKVLLVDDVSMFIELQKEYLQFSAVDILTARDGKEALAICQAERPVLVCMDLNMPIMNGAECCRAIKKDPQLRETNVIMITSEGKDADRRICFEAGCDDFITKPLDRNVFLETARKLLPAIDRRDKRVACHLKAKYRAVGATLSGIVLNLSQHGAYLATNHEIEHGSILDLIFALPDPYGSIIQLRGRAAWLNTKTTRRKSTMPEGFGIEFLAPDENTLKDLARYVESEPGII